ncbi:MAG: site-specific integrase [Spirochaetaceae bacterium]|nr:site-specific integrase [Spirochaetaceae bacterium]
MKKIKYRLVYNRRKLLNKQGTALIQVEASLGKHKTYFGTRIYIRPEEWDKRTSSIVNHPHANDLNLWLYEFIVKLEELELSIWKKGATPTLQQIRDAVESKHTEGPDFQTFCTSCIKKSQRKQSTRNNLLGTLALIQEFHPIKAWESLNYTFLKNFEHWMKSKGYAVNTIAKHLRNLRTLTREAISAGVFDKEANPFLQFTIKQEKIPHRFLNPEELSIVENARLEGTLEHIRNAFLFCCYTGLRFSDFKQLDCQNISEQGGAHWLRIKTEKTGYYVQIPLHLIFGGKALGILNRYTPVEKLTKIGSNASVNRQLAELQKKLGITTRITFHTARHTCATLLCHQGIPITTIQKILGHSSVTTTQVYSEVMAETIVRDLEKVR